MCTGRREVACFVRWMVRFPRGAAFFENTGSDQPVMPEIAQGARSNATGFRCAPRLQSNRRRLRGRSRRYEVARWPQPATPPCTRPHDATAKSRGHDHRLHLSSREKSIVRRRRGSSFRIDRAATEMACGCTRLSMIWAVDWQPASVAAAISMSNTDRRVMAGSSFVGARLADPGAA